MKEFKEIRSWRLSIYKLINFGIGMAALLIYEFIGRPYYRPYIYSNKINDFHLADTLGNSLGTIAIIFIIVSLFSDEKTKGKSMIVMGTVVAVLMEFIHPLLGKPIDILDIFASLVTGIVSFVIFKNMFKN
ncbi:MAG: hypothetical protein H7X84_03875 [Verrucomicrobia bacterium]|nr:hypothetical protein [Prolixibacteraceae bacterium]